MSFLFEIFQGKAPQNDISVISNEGERPLAIRSLGGRFFTSLRSVQNDIAL